MSAAGEFPMLTTIVQAIQGYEGGRGLNMLAAENVRAVVAAIEAAGFSIIQGPLPIEDADKGRTILAYSTGEGVARRFFWRWDNDARNNGARPHWYPLHGGRFPGWAHAHQPTHFWYPPE